MNGGSSGFQTLRNGETCPLDRIPCSDPEALVQAAAGRLRRDCRIASYFARKVDGGSGLELVAILADDQNGTLLAGRASMAGASFPSLTASCPQAHLFEREIAEQFGLTPAGHPWLKPVRFAKPMGRPAGAPPAPSREAPAIGLADFFRVEGEGIHEVAVGPVHAGVIEPGHFRFQCYGEQVLHLEISLGYQHRGIEEALIGGPRPITIHQMETAAGDASIAHAWAYCQNLEALAGLRVPARAHALRALALEMERLANHTGDLGALSGDVAYLPTAAFCGRIRGDFLNMTALLCGNRFGRNFIAPGGARFDLSPGHIQDLLQRLQGAEADVSGAVELLWVTPSVMARFENIGAVSKETAAELGLVGPAARASGLERDIRSDHPAGIYQFASIPVATAEGGDVHARAFVRWLEIQRSTHFIRERLRSLPEAGASGRLGSLAPGCLAVSLVEGWRGEVCHTAITDAQGRFSRYKIVDPSFHNWMGLAMALRDQQISDFPLCNKSFNLSYCGVDL